MDGQIDCFGPRDTKRCLAYELRCQGWRWRDIAYRLPYANKVMACNHAKRHAQTYGLPWPAHGRDA